MTDIAMEAGTFRLADVFSKSFAIYSRRFVPFIILTVIASIPDYIAVLTLAGSARGPAAGEFSGAQAVLVLVNMATKSLASAAVIYGVVQELRGRAFSVSDSIRIALSRILTILGVTFCAAIAIGLGSLLLAVPGLMLLCRYYVAAPVCVAERTGVFESLGRSAFLTKGYRWQVFGTIMLLGIVGIVLSLVLSGIFGAVFAMTGSIAFLVASQALGAVLGSFYGVIVSVFYYELRVAKEGVDIEKIASVFD
jgi:hypothetical protein